MYSFSGQKGFTQRDEKTGKTLICHVILLHNMLETRTTEKLNEMFIRYVFRKIDTDRYHT